MSSSCARERRRAVADERRVATMPRPGLWAWTFVGLCAALAIVAVVVAALNEILLPTDLRRCSRGGLQARREDTRPRWRLRPSVSAGVVVLGLLAVGTIVVVVTANGVVDQLDQIGSSVDAAAAEAQGPPLAWTKPASTPSRHRRPRWPPSSAVGS